MSRRPSPCPTCGANPRARDLGRTLSAIARAQAELKKATEAVWGHLERNAKHQARKVGR
jgi:hypothetical protein